MPVIPQTFGFTGSGPGIASSFFLENDVAYSFRYTTFSGLDQNGVLLHAGHSGWVESSSVELLRWIPPDEHGPLCRRGVTCTFTIIQVDPRYFTVVLVRPRRHPVRREALYLLRWTRLPVRLRAQRPSARCQRRKMLPKVINNFLDNPGITDTVAQPNSGGENETFTCDDGSSPARSPWARTRTSPVRHFQGIAGHNARVPTQPSSGQEFDFTWMGRKPGLDLHRTGPTATTSPRERTRSPSPRCRLGGARVGDLLRRAPHLEHHGRHRRCADDLHLLTELTDRRA